MKKLFLMLLAIALVGSFAFAEVTGVDAPSVSAEVTTTFGYNLDAEASGFDTSADVDVVVPLAAGSDTHSGEGDMYAEITIEDIDISLSTDDEDVSYDASVSAKLVMGNMYINLGKDDMSFNAVNLDTDIETDVNAYDDDANVDFNADVAGSAGIGFGYVADAFSFEIGVASKNDAYNDGAADTAVWLDGDYLVWDDLNDDGVIDAGEIVLDQTKVGAAEDDSTDWLDSNESDEEDFAAADDPNVDHEYVFGLNASFVAGPAAVDVYAAYDATYGTDSAGDDAALTGVGLSSKIDLTVAMASVAMDYVMFGDNWGFEAAAGIGTALPGVGTISASVFYNVWDLSDYVGLGLVDVTGTHFQAGLDYEADLAEALSLTVGVLFDNIIDTYDDENSGILALLGVAEDKLSIELDVAAGYDLGTVAPYTEIGFDYSTDSAIDPSMELALGADFAVIDNAVLNVEYSSGDVLDFDNNKGLFTVGVTVTY